MLIGNSSKSKYKEKRREEMTLTEREVETLMVVRDLCDKILREVVGDTKAKESVGFCQIGRAHV